MTFAGDSEASLLMSRIESVWSIIDKAAIESQL